MILQMLALIFFLLTNTERSLLFLCSHFFIESTSLFPFIFNTSVFIHRTVFVLETNLSTVGIQKWRKSFLPENRYSFSSNHYCTLALMCFRFVCLFYLFFIFIYSIIVLSCLRDSRVMSIRAATMAGLLSVGAFILLCGQSFLSLSACR